MKNIIRSLIAILTIVISISSVTPFAFAQNLQELNMDTETDTRYKTIVDNYDEEHDNRISAFVSKLVEFINMRKWSSKLR